VPSYRKKHHEPESNPPSAPPVAADEAGVGRESAILQPAPAPNVTVPAMEAEPAPSPQQTETVDDLRKRLADMEQAQRIAEQRHLIAANIAQPQHQPAQPQQQPTIEDEIEQRIAPYPERAKNFLRARPEYLTNPRLNAALQHYHYEVAHAFGQFTDAYYQRMEELLGLAAPAQSPQPVNGHDAQEDSQRESSSVSESSPTMTSPPPMPPRRPIVPQRATEPPKPAPPAPPPQYNGPHVSAPPTREVPSMSTGRSTPPRVTLNRDEQEIALASKRDPSMSDAQALEEYARQKIRFEALKRAGQYPEGRPRCSK